MSPQFWLIQALNSVAMGGFLFLLAVGFSLIFGLLRVPNLAHGGFFMLGAYLGATVLDENLPFWLAALAGAAAVGLLGVVLERLLLRRLAGNEQAQVLTTLGIAFIIADLCLMTWGGDPISLAPPDFLSRAIAFGGFFFPAYRLAVLALAVIVAILVVLLMERTRLGAMIRAGVDDREMARGVGIPVSRLFTAVFFLGTALAGLGGVIGGPILSAYPGLDFDMLPLALIVVILGGIGSIAGAFAGSMIVGFIYNFGIALFPSFAYVILFLPMIIALIVKPEGLFGRVPQ
ncbi:MAG TPA: branched-chain amino acid ABC transporter permease [Acetobacteraceae bacterium]|nr:branched-chain amino acid ABC transporter permease [Acetobacteraceae bacterium]